MSHRVQLKGVRKNRGKNSHERAERRLPWEEVVHAEAPKKPARGTKPAAKAKKEEQKPA